MNSIATLRMRLPHNMSFPRKPGIPLAMMLLLLLVIGVYLPGLSGPFVLDDAENIANIPAIALDEMSLSGLRQAAIANDSGPLGRPLSSLSFALNHYFAGGFEDTRPYKAANLVIHLVNVLLVYFLARLLLSTPALRDRVEPSKIPATALFVATLWALHPIQLTNVLYVVQRMNSLAAAFTLIGLIAFVYGRKQLEGSIRRGLLWMSTGIATGTLFGVLAKENAALLPLFAFVIDLSLFRRSDDVHVRRTIRAFYAAVLAFPFAAGAAYFLWRPELLLDSYLGRDFTMTERLLSEARVLWTYVSAILLPTPAQFGIFHDDILPSRSLLAPPTTVFAITGLALITVLAWKHRHAAPLFLLGWTWFLAGHSLEAGVFALELAFEHRNYLPSFGALFALGVGLSSSRVLASARASLPLALSLAVVLALATANLAHVWSSARTLAEHGIRHYPASPRAISLVAGIQLDAGDHEAALSSLRQGTDRLPTNAGLLLQLRLLETLIGGNAGGSREHAALDQRLLVALRTEPVSAHVAMLLDEMQRCVFSSHQPCAQLAEPLLAWNLAAAANLRSPRPYRAMLLANIAEFHAHARRYDQALGSLTQSLAVLPAQPHRLLREIEYLLQAGRTEKALARLRALAPKINSSESAWIRQRDRYEQLCRQAGAPC